MKKVIRKWMKLDPVTGKPKPTVQFEGGAYHAIRKVPKSLGKPNSRYWRILAILNKNRLTQREVFDNYNHTYGDKIPRGTVSAILSALFTYGLIVHWSTNKRGGLWSLKEGIDINDTDSLIRIAEESIKKLKCIK